MSYLTLKYLLDDNRNKKYPYPFTEEIRQKNYNRYLYISELRKRIRPLIEKHKRKIEKNLRIEDQDRYKFFPNDLTWKINVNGEYKICTPKYRSLSRKEVIKRNKEFFSSKIWLNYKQKKSRNVSNKTMRMSKRGTR